MIIDWECSRFTKEACPRNAEEEWLVKLTDPKYYRLKDTLSVYGEKTLKKLNLRTGMKLSSKNYHEVFEKVKESEFFKDMYEDKPLGDSIEIEV